MDTAESSICAHGDIYNRICGSWWSQPVRYSESDFVIHAQCHECAGQGVNPYFPELLRLIG